MRTELLIEIAYSALNDELCDGCRKYGLSYSYENNWNCEKCRSIAMEEIKSILEKQKNN